MATLKEELSLWWTDLLNIIFPNICEVCGTTLVRGESTICTQCRLDIPRTGIHTDSFSRLHHRLASTDVSIERAAGYFYYYRGNPYARLLHLAKYNGRHKIAHILGADYAKEIFNTGFFNGIDMLVPVPLHRTRLFTRGYNQSLHIADGISEITGIAVADILKSKRMKPSQTHKNRYERWLNAKDNYCAICDPQLLSEKHVLIIDDVMTTGATLLACAKAITSISPSSRISVLTLGVTHMR